MTKKPSKPISKPVETSVKLEDAQEGAKLARTEEEAVPSKEDTKEVPSVAVGPNPAEIPWPNDRWGFTTEFRKAVTKLGQGTKHSPDKREMVKQHLQITAAFLEAKYESDVATSKYRMQKIYGKEGDANASESTGNPAE